MTPEVADAYTTAPTQEKIDSWHYLPANNVFADAMIGGVDEAITSLQEKLTLQKESLNRAAAEHGVVIHQDWWRYIDWYEASCRHCIEQISKGEPIKDDYPRFGLS